MANNEDDPLSKFRGVMPSRAELCQLVLFGTSEKIRAAAQSVLDLLPPMTTKERKTGPRMSGKRRNFPARRIC
jgi:hypothetical protein